MLRKVAAVLVSIILSIYSAGCSANISDLFNSQNAESSAGQDNKNGVKPEQTQVNSLKEFMEINGKKFEGILEVPAGTEILEIAKGYYEMAYPFIEADVRSEYTRVVKWQPDFSGGTTDPELARLYSGNVAVTVNTTNARNFYLALAAAVFSLDSQNSLGAGNLAAAISSYYDDLADEGGSPIQKAFYEDAVTIYRYGISEHFRMLEQYENSESGKPMFDLEDVLPLLVSLGNLYMDNEKFDKAVICFEAAMDINTHYPPARKGMYNYYMAKKQLDKALKILAEDDMLVFQGVMKKNGSSKDYEKEVDVPDTDQPDEAFEKVMDELCKTEPLSIADYLAGVDPEASRKMKELLKSVQGKMKYTAPDITEFTEIMTIKQASSPKGMASLNALAYALGTDQSALGLQIESQLNYLDDLGIKIDWGGFDIQDAIENPEKYENYEPDVKVSGVENAIDYAKKMQEAASETIKSDTGDPKGMYKVLAQTRHEYRIFDVNPFSYTNAIDLLVQRENVLAFNRKFDTYNTYLGKVNMEAFEKIQEYKAEYMNKCSELSNAMASELENAEDDYECHRVHAKYYPQLNKAAEYAWNQATGIAVKAYNGKKVKYYLEQMYKDCIKHAMLISDATIQKEMEDRLKTAVINNSRNALYNTYSAFTAALYLNPFDCDCDVEELKAAREAANKEREKMANEQIKKNMEAKKKFESGEIDENSEYYEKIIKPYEVRISTPFTEGVVGPYKSSFKLSLSLPGLFDAQLGHEENHYANTETWERKLDCPAVGVNYKEFANHRRNTTTYEGGLSLGYSATIGAVSGSMKAIVGFSAIKGSNGEFSADDFDLTTGGEVGIGIGNIQATAGTSVSSLRGSRKYGNVSLSGDKLIDEDLKAAMGKWAPSLTKEIWKGEYPGK